MNEKIKELAEQADITNTNLSDGNMSYNDLEKFAELIVKECIDYCGENLSKTVGGALKIHFGIKE
jgi:hypothetical protein